MRICSIDGCGRACYGLGLCRAHWKRQRTGKAMDRPVERRTPRGAMCRFCTYPVRARGLCTMHYARWRKHGNALTTAYDNKPLCSVSGCYELAAARGWCSMHYERWRHNGDPLIVRRRVRKVA